MKNLLTLTAGLALVGILGAAACSGCPPPEEDSGSSGSSGGSQMRCGEGTVMRGNECVAANRAVAPAQRGARDGSGTGHSTLATDN
jgi:hypothetical protein